MQEHIEWLKATLDICEDTAPSLVNCLKLCINDAESKLEMEKEQIEDAYIMGSYDMAAKEFKPNEYYNETFKQQEQ